MKKNEQPAALGDRSSTGGRLGFTLVELLITITIIGLLATLSLKTMQSAQNSAREAATRATIAKLDAIIQERYNSYLTRRVPVDLTLAKDGKPMSPSQAAQDRLYAIRDLIRMEMPERLADIFNFVSGGAIDYNIAALPIVLPNSGKSITPSGLVLLYRNYYTSHPPGASIPGKECQQAEMLYLTVSMGSPEAMEQFRPSEIGDTDGNGWLEFLDGWGRPINWLRWAPGFSPFSAVQKPDPVKYHDPFDPQRQDLNAYHLIPLIYSYGPDGKPGLDIEDPVGHAYDFNDTFGDMFANDYFKKIGMPLADAGGTSTDYEDNITNHQLSIGR